MTGGGVVTHTTNPTQEVTVSRPTTTPVAPGQVRRFTAAQIVRVVDYLITRNVVVVEDINTARRMVVSTVEAATWPVVG